MELYQLQMHTEDEEFLVEKRVTNRIKYIEWSNSLCAMEAKPSSSTSCISAMARVTWYAERRRQKDTEIQFGYIKTENNNRNGIYKHVPMSIFSELGMSET